MLTQALTFMYCMLLSELIPLFPGSLSPLDPYVDVLYWFQFEVPESIDHDCIRI